MFVEPDVPAEVPVYSYEKFPRDSVRVVIGPHHFVHPSFRMHRHTYGELVIVTHGTGVHLMPELDYRLCARDVFYIPPGAAHGFGGATGMGITNIAFDPAVISAAVHRSLAKLSGYHAIFNLSPYSTTAHGAENRLSLTGVQLRSLMPLLDRMKREFEIRDPGFDTLMLSSTLELITRICRIFSPRSQFTANVVHRVARAASRIERDFAQPLRLEDLAREAKLSPNHLLRLFSQAYGVTPIQLLTRVRLDHARDLLVTTSLPIAEIAEASGFPDQSYFSRVFRSVVGGTPREYRRAGGRGAGEEARAAHEVRAQVVGGLDRK